MEKLISYSKTMQALDVVEARFSSGIAGAAVSECAIAVINQPEVDAIPVEWLQEQAELTARRGPACDPELNAAIDCVLKAWNFHKIQEAARWLALEVECYEKTRS